jgi:hypothetical protein
VPTGDATRGAEENGKSARLDRDVREAGAWLQPRRWRRRAINRDNHGRVLRALALMAFCFMRGKSHSESDQQVAVELVVAIAFEAAALGIDLKQPPSSGACSLA